jgi:aerotaxis receptor
MNKRFTIEKEVKFKDIIASERPAVIKIDTNGKITYANTVFGMLSGYKREELLGRPESILRHPDMPNAIIEDMQRKLKNNESWSGFVKFLRKDGRFFWANTFISPIREDGKVVGFILINRGVSEDIVREVKEKYETMRREEK